MISENIELILIILFAVACCVVSYILSRTYIKKIYVSWKKHVLFSLLLLFISFICLCLVSENGIQDIAAVFVLLSLFTLIDLLLIGLFGIIFIISRMHCKKKNREYKYSSWFEMAVEMAVGKKPVDYNERVVDRLRIFISIRFTLFFCVLFLSLYDFLL